MNPQPEARPAEHVILHGDCWPVVSAVEGMINAILPDCRCSTAPDLTSLIRLLARNPQAVLILCLRPREHLFLFYALKPELLYHPALVISDECFFSDGVILRAWGGLPRLSHRELARTVVRRRHRDRSTRAPEDDPDSDPLTCFLTAPALPSGLSEVPQIFYLEQRLMDYLSLLMYREMLDRGITSLRMRLLQEMYTGHQSYSELATVMDVSEQKVWNDKHQLFRQLGMSGRLRNLLYGTRFCAFLQRTPFMSPDEAENLREQACRPGTPIRSAGTTA